MAKVMFLVNQYNESWTEREYNSQTETYHNVTYFWWNEVSSRLGSGNVKKYHYSSKDFDTFKVLANKDTYLQPDASNSGSNFSSTIKNQIASFKPQVLVIEYGMECYNESKTKDGDGEPAEAAVNKMETYQEIYNYCYINGIQMVIVVYNEKGLKLDASENHKTYLNKLIYQQETFAKTKNLSYINLGESFYSIDPNDKSKKKILLNKNGHLQYADLLISACSTASSKYTSNLSQILSNQRSIPEIKNTYVPQIEKFRARETKIAFLNATYIDSYYEPSVSGSSINGTSGYFWPKLASARLGNIPYRMFCVRRRPMAELVEDEEQAWNIVKYNPAVIVLESGLFDYTVDMYDKEPATRVGDILSTYAFIYQYCIEQSVALVISTYGILDYEYYKTLNPDDPLFTESHKRYHAALQEKVMDFCYFHDITCNNIRLDDRFGIENFSNIYLSDGVSLSRLGHIAYSENVADAIKRALEKMDRYIKDTEMAINDANIESRKYAAISPDVRDTVQQILKNIAVNTDYSQERNKSASTIIDPKLPVIIDESMQTATNKTIGNKKLQNTSQNNTYSSTVNNSIQNTTSNTDSINKFQNISNILKKKMNTDNMAELAELYNPALINAAKQSAQDHTKYEALRAQKEQERDQIIQSSIAQDQNEELVGDGQIDDPELVVSFEICRMLDKDDDHHCKYMDIENRCIFDHCIYDTDELPRFTRKWYTKCIICTEVFARDPRYMKAPFCDSCISRMQAAEKLPFTCINCGNSQDTPSLIMFSSICDYCVQHILFNSCCLEFKMSPKGIHGVDTNHEPVY